jgi:hypothetical protein
MPISYRIDPEKNLILETWSGKICAADLRAYWMGYLADTQVMEIRRTVVDLRGSVIDFSGKELWTLVRSIVEPALKGREWTSALVVQEDSAEYGVSRQYQVFAENYSKDCIFNSVAEAEKWICSKDS